MIYLHPYQVQVQGPYMRSRPPNYPSYPPCPTSCPWCNPRITPPCPPCTCTPTTYVLPPSGVGGPLPQIGVGVAGGTLGPPVPQLTETEMTEGAAGAITDRRHLPKGQKGVPTVTTRVGIRLLILRGIVEGIQEMIDLQTGTWTIHMISNIWVSNSKNLF